MFAIVSVLYSMDSGHLSDHSVCSEREWCVTVIGYFCLVMRLYIICDHSVCGEYCSYLGFVLLVECVLEFAARSVGALCEARGECALGLGQFLGRKERR